MNEKVKLRHISFTPMFLLSLLTNKDSKYTNYTTLTTQYSENGSEYPVLEPVLEL